MATQNKGSAKKSTPRQKPALSPEARENQMISLAVDCAERQLMDGTATSQVITHYLKLGSSKERLEQEKIKHEVALLEAKRQDLQSSKRVEELYEDALSAMRQYGGQDGDRH